MTTTPSSLEERMAAIRRARATCPSDLRLERYAKGEGAKQGDESVETHLRGCLTCREIVERARKGFDDATGLDADATWDRIVQAADVGDGARVSPPVSDVVPHASTRRPRSDRAADRNRSAWLWGVGTFALAAGTMLFFVRPETTAISSSDSEEATRADALAEGPAPQPGVRSKGTDLSLLVHRDSASGSEIVHSGERLAPGDRLRFQVTLPAAGFVGIVGQEASGQLYRAWPLEGSDDFARVDETATHVLPGAIELDASTGREWLHLVHCPLPAAPPPCEVQGAEIQCAAGCQLTSFAVDKTPAPPPVP